MSGFKFVDALEQIPKLLPSTFTRASQAWDGTGLVAPDTMRVFGRDTKSPVVLIEGQRTNTIANSTDINAWNAHGDAVLSVSPMLAPDGSSAAIRLTSGVEGTALRAHTSGGASEGVPFVGSIWLRSDEEVQVVMASNSGGAAEEVTVLPEWQRFSLYSPGGGGTRQVQIRSSGGQPFIVGMWGVQIESAPFASSYIPTVGSLVTRAREYGVVSSVTLTEAVTIHVGTLNELNPVSIVRGMWRFGDGQNQLRYLRLYVWEGDFGIAYRDLGDSGATTTLLGTAPAGPTAVSAVLSNNRLMVVVNGEVRADTEFALPGSLVSNLNHLNIGTGGLTDAAYEGCVAPGAAQLGIPFIDNRAWSAAEIQAAHARWLPELAKIEVPV